MIASIVQAKELWQTVVASVAAGIGVTFAFSMAIWGVGQFSELSRNDRPLAAALAAVAASLALTAVAAAVVFGIVVMTHK
ncbi:MAG TPA: hypothetical protein VNB59_00975 [Solirubrobacterales bacterium]|jgi:hypothetical protein|nr:hypothetical protein [Solirubrobacterales bacterium]